MIVITQRDVEQAYLDYSATHGGVKEDYFGLLYVMRLFKIPREQAATQVAFSGNDYGFDGFHFDREARNLYLYQFKWSSDARLFKQSFKRLIEAGMDAVFGSSVDPRENPLLAQIRATIRESKALIERVFADFVFTGDPAVAEQSAFLGAVREDLEDKKYLIRQTVGRDNIDFRVRYISTSGGTKGDSSPDRPAYSFEVAFHSPLRTETSNGFTMHVGFMSLADLARMYNAMKELLFDRNIRSGLGADKPANRAIKNALREILLNGRAADTFVFNHNGITISTQHVDYISDTQVRVVEPRVLNGAQTISTVSDLIKDSNDNEVFKANQPKLDETRVLARLICANSQDFVTHVTICNNRQNPVNAWNLRASDYIQLQFADYFRDSGVFYERQEGAFRAFLELPSEEREERHIYENKPVEIRKLAYTFLASQGEISRFSKIADVFESEDTYRKTFKEAYLGVDQKRVLLAYKIQLPLARVVNNVIDAGAAKYEILRHAKSLIWALLFQAIWNHSKFQEWVESYGSSMVVEFAFVDLLSSLATSKIKPIIADGLKRPQRQASVANGKFGFLRTTDFYNECMDIAWQRYQWKKFSLQTAAAGKS